VVPSDVMTTHNISLTSGNRSGSGTIEMVELSKVVVQGHPLIHEVHCPCLT
jgi:hypothetical protein